MTEVWAGMATLSDRADSRALAVNSILPQVDRLIVVPGDRLGDQAKFLAAADAPDDAVYLGVDDDLIYPPGYVNEILTGLNRHPGHIVSFHGWKLDETGEPYVENYRCLENLGEDVAVHVAGTGVCAFHISTIRPVMGDFESVNADVWLAVRAQERGIPRVVLAHRSYWLGYVQGAAQDDGPTRSVYAHTRHRTGTVLDGSAGFERATRRLTEMIYGGDET